MLTGLLYGLALTAIAFLVGWIYFFLKALKDPDVRVSSKLSMTINRYHLYRELYEELQEVMRTYGTDSPYVDKFFRFKVLPRIKNLDEWRRYQEFRLEIQCNRIIEEIEELKTK